MRQLDLGVIPPIPLLDMFEPPQGLSFCLEAMMCSFGFPSVVADSYGSSLIG